MVIRFNDMITMYFGIPSFIWSIIYIVIGLWLTMRILAAILQFVIKKKTGILVKIAYVRIFAFHKIHISVKEGLQVEIDKVWLSSSYFNEAVRQPLVLCMGEVRIQANSNGKKDNGAFAQTARHQSHTTPAKEFALPKIATYLQHVGITIQSLTMMLLKTMVADCLIHVEGQQLGLDISSVEDGLQFIIKAGNINCRALRSVTETDDQSQNKQPCLAEMSFSLHLDLSVYRNNIKRVKASHIFVDRPQIMVTEGLLSGTHYLRQDDQWQRHKQPADGQTSLILELLPQELDMDISCVDVKIVRETKQRSLSVGIKAFHVELFNQLNVDDTREVRCNLLIEDFNTKSQQARFADLLKLEVTSGIYRDDIKLKMIIHKAYFHYHHDEVQYWVLVMKQFLLKGDNQRVNSELVNLSYQTERESSISRFLFGKNVILDTELVDISTAISTASCIGFILGVSSVVKHVTIQHSIHDSGLPWLQSHDLSAEMEINTLYCRHFDAQIPVNDFAGKKHFWNHVLYMNIVILKINKLGDELRLEGMEDQLHVEWSSSTINMIISLLSALAKAKISAPRRLSNAAFRSHRHRNPNIPIISEMSRYRLSMKFNMTSTNLFLCNSYNVCLMLCVDTASLHLSQNQAVVTIEGTKLVYLRMKDKFLALVKSSDIDQPAASLKEIRIKYETVKKECTIQFAKEVFIDWKTASHMCIIQALEDVHEFNSKTKGDLVNQPLNIAVTHHHQSDKDVRLSVHIMVTTQVSVKIHLSEKHSVTLKADKLLSSISPHEVLTEMEQLSILCDDQQIFCFEGVLLSTLPESQLKEERKSFKTLTLKSNRAWNIATDQLSIIFPYNFDFAVCFEEFTNFQKWLKMVHKIKKKPFTVDSKLPPDLQIKVKSFKMEIDDNPFEVKLGDNYELMKDEYLESEKRRCLLDQKVQNLKKEYGIIQAHKIEEVYASLSKSNSDIYIQRSQQLYQITPLRIKLFTWIMENVEIVALADTSIHGKENVLENMKDIDSDSPYPDEGIEFVTLWGRFINFGVKAWNYQFRDFPQLTLDIKDMNVWGRLIGAEIEGSRRAKRSCTVEVERPWGNATVERNLPALKFFHDFSCDVVSFEMAYGACWEPYIAQYNQALDLINKPSVDPSKPLPWWDKSRLLLHGRLTMTVSKMNWLYHASFDPYNTTEFMDWQWTDLVLDWLNMKFVLKGDLDIYARTASKYDDCRLLQLPNLKFCAKVDWLCLADPNDHYLVMPCAPDRVPDYSLEEHDSFRAFRSQNLNLSISLETSRSKSMSMESSKSKSMLKETKTKYPNALFYASTLKFLDKIKMCLASVTRPIRRGPLFNNVKPRKLQFTRHFKYAQLSINFHQFDVCYWISFSRQHGAKFSGNSFILELRNELAINPIQDSLIHRPSADWSVIYLSSVLTGTKIWLCSSQVRLKDELDVSTSGKPVETSFFLSVSKVSYQRSSTNTTEPLQEEKQTAKPPTHNVQVYEMRGSWNKENRTVLIGLYDSYMKAQSLKRNLSSEALKGFKVEGGNNTSSSRINLKGMGSSVESPDFDAPGVSSNIQTGHAHSMLMKLVAESDSKSVAFTEEPSSSNMDQLQGVAACQSEDVVQRNWQIELLNSQIIVKGCETQGFLIVAAAKAKILSSTYAPVWVRDNQLRSKDTWIGSVECMQYYATVNHGNELCDENIPWLSKTHVEDRSEPEPSSLQEMAGSGHSVGGIVNTSYSGTSKSQTIQLQRIISRCKCQFFYVNYGEVDPNLLQEVPPPPSGDSDMIERDEGVDTFTLLHHDLNVCTNHLQYVMIMDIVDNLLLHVELKKKEATEKLQSMRFQLQLSRVEDQKTPIMSIQESLRQQMELYRHSEKELFMVLKALEEEYENDSYAFELKQDQETLEGKLRYIKERINILNEELSIRISCFKESQLQVQASLQAKQTQQANVIRRNEVCFKFAQWRLTEPDGQVGIADLALRNFVYTKVNRDNDTWSHQVELGWVKVTNLLPNSVYKDVLAPQDPPGKDDNRKMTLRVLCSERPPVGGIAVKEHFEVNIVPLQIQMTYQLYKKVMEFFFPDKNIETEDQDDDFDAASPKPMARSEKRSSKREVKRTQSFPATDDIDIMKERAANNNTFLYIKIPEVSLKVSYKGEKEKNIIRDIHDFNLVLPTLEYHNCIWTWFDLLMTMKNDSKRVLISQAIKQKLHMKSRLGDELPLTDVQQEEDKAKMLLGAKLLAPQEKPAKKTLFGKSPK